MSAAAGARLIQACESLCNELRRGVGLTAFTIELDRSTTPLVITLRGPDVVTGVDQRHDPRAPACLELVVSDGDRRVATVRIEDASRAEYPDEARAACERIAAAYAPELSTLLAASQPDRAHPFPPFLASRGPAPLSAGPRWSQG